MLASSQVEDGGYNFMQAGTSIGLPDGNYEAEQREVIINMPHLAKNFEESSKLIESRLEVVNTINNLLERTGATRIQTNTVVIENTDHALTDRISAMETNIQECQTRIDEDRALRAELNADLPFLKAMIAWKNGSLHD